jgi:hypothetical protein
LGGEPRIWLCLWSFWLFMIRQLQLRIIWFSLLILKW